MQEQKYAVYRYQEQYLPPEKCNIDDCTKIYERSLFDVNADPDSLGEMLNGIVSENNLYRGDIIYLNNTAYHIGEWQFTKIPDFMQSRAEAERKRQEQIERERQEELARQERLAEEQRRLEEQKKKKEEETTKQVQHKTRNKLHL